MAEPGQETGGAAVLKTVWCCRAPRLERVVDLLECARASSRRRSAGPIANGVANVNRGKERPTFECGDGAPCVPAGPALDSDWGCFACFRCRLRRANDGKVRVVNTWRSISNDATRPNHTNGRRSAAHGSAAKVQSAPHVGSTTAAPRAPAHEKAAPSAAHTKHSKKMTSSMAQAATMPRQKV
jgi:hypothetical protein